MQPYNPTGTNWNQPQTCYPQAGYPSNPMGMNPTQPMPGYPTSNAMGINPGQPMSGYPTQPTPGYPASNSMGINPTQSMPGYPTQPTPGYPGFNNSNVIGFGNPQPSAPAMYPSGDSGFNQCGFGQLGQNHSQYPTGMGTPANINPYPAPQGGQHSAMGSYYNPSGIAPTMPAEHQGMEPSVLPAPNFDPKLDCERLKKAMKGIGTDEKELIAVLTKRTVEQRVEITKTYKSLFGKDLKKHLKSEISGNFYNCMKLLCMSRAEFDAYQLHKAIEGAGTDEDAIIEILCTRTQSQIKEIKDVYAKENKGHSLEKDLKDDTSGHFKKACISLLQCSRDESKTVDMAAVQRDAQELYSAGVKRIGTDESVFNKILTNRSYSHLRAMFDVYTSVGKQDFEQALKSELSGSLLKTYLAIVRCTKNQAAFFASKLYDAMKIAGTVDHALIRIIVSQCDVNLGNIKKEFLKLTGETLKYWVSKETSGDYKAALLSLIGD